MKKPNKKTLALTIVAFVLVLMSLISFTFSWIDDIKLVEFQNADVADGAPLKAGTDINATVKITKTENEINLGNMIKPSDITIQNYEYDEGYTAPHATYPRNEEEATKQQEFIDKNKGYFYESGGMHFSPCFGDGESFYFQRQGGQSGYREANKDDENVNYISFTTKVSSPDASTDFWFDSMPTIQGKNAGGSTVDVSDYARYAIIVDGECHVYSSTGAANTCNSGLTGTIPVTGVRKTSNYTYGDNTNTTAERGANSNTLFSIKKGGTVNMTVKIWLEGGFNNTVTASNINLKLISSWSKTRKIWIDDKTTNGGGGSWLNDPYPDGDPAKLYVTFPVFLYEKSTNPADWPNITNGPFYPITVDNTTHKGYVTVPLVYNNEKMIFYRCNNTYWNSNASDAQQRSDYNVYCWNWWQTNTPNTYCDETYTLYGGSKDSTAQGYFQYPDSWITNKGYGTWGDVEQIRVNAVYNSNDLASKGSGKAMYIVDYSDKDTSGETYIYEMFRSSNQNEDPDEWKAYVPVTSSKIQFRYFGGDNPIWGYDSWETANPQRRPLASTGLYPYNATVYQLGAIFYTDHGWGYWRDTQGNDYDKVYLVKSKYFADTNINSLYAYMYDDNSHKNGNWPGVQMSRMQDASGNYVKWSDNVSPVMQSDPARNGSSTIYNHLNFDDGTNPGVEKTNKTPNLDVFPGCFYNPNDGENGTWYGAINDNGRAASTEGNNDSNNDGTTDVTTTVPTGDGLYAYGQLLGGNSYVEYAKFSSTGVGGFIVLNLTAGNSYQFTLSKKTSNDTDEYGNNAANVGPVLSNTNKGEWRLIHDNDHKQKIKLDVRTTGKYKISIKNVESTNFNLEFEYLSS